MQNTHFRMLLHFAFDSNLYGLVYHMLQLVNSVCKLDVYVLEVN